MLINIHNLTGTDACIASRKFPLELDTERPIAAKTAAATIKAVSSFLIDRNPWEDVKKEFEEDISELSFYTEAEKQEVINDRLNQIWRYVSDEDRKLYPAKGLDIDVGKDLTVHVKPTFISEDEEHMEVILIKCSKPTIGPRTAQSDLLMYSLYRYGKSVAPNKEITASVYFLRKKTDVNGQNPHFDHWFFVDEERGGSNIVQLSGDEKDLETRFEPIIASYVAGIEAESCSKEDCEKCSLKELCLFSHPPQKMVLSKAETKSLAALRLTSSQQKVVSYEKGILRVNAGAGAGKTTVVALRVATLIMKGYDPSKILCITFTNNGANEMRERIKAICEDFEIEADVYNMPIMTINSFGDSILKAEYERFGFTEEPELCDEVDIGRIVSDLFKSYSGTELSFRNYSEMLLRNTVKVFDTMKAYNLNSGDINEILNISELPMTYKQCEVIAELYNDFDAKMKENNLIQYSDQEAVIYDILYQDPDFFENLGYEHIIVDEFQDTAPKQIELLKNLMNTGSFKSLMIVGDDSQSIYGFRHTTPDLLINFPKYIGKPVDDIQLVENHRSTPEILEAANKVNAQRHFKLDKDLVATRASGKPVEVKGFLKSADEIRFIAEQVKAKIDDGTNPSDIAVICATSTELAKMGDALTEAGVPSIMLNPEPLLENSRVLAALSLVRFLINPSNTADALSFANAVYGGGFIMADESYLKHELDNMLAMQTAFSSMNADERKEYLMYLLGEIDEDDEIYEAFLKKLERRNAQRLIQYCLDFMAFGKSTAIRRMDKYPGVALITAHSAKGMEWPVVFLSVSKFSTESLYKGAYMSKIEEKLRLLFVSMTRARDELTVTGQFVAFGKKGNYTYNYFLKTAADAALPLKCAESFDPEQVIKYREYIEKLAKESKKLSNSKKKAVVTA